MGSRIKANDPVEGVVVCFVSRICGNNGSRGRVTALGRTSLGSKAEGTMPSLQLVEVTQTWSGGLSGGVMSHGAKPQGSI